MAKDADFAKVSLLLHCDGLNGAKVAADSSYYAHVPTLAGDAVISTTKSKFGGASLFTGSGTNAITTIPSSTAFDFGSGDMTIEMFFSSTNTADNATLITREWVSSPWTGGWTIQLNGGTSGPLRVYWADWSPSGPFMVGTTTTHRDGNMHHLAWTKQGNVHRLFLDGIQQATQTVTTAFGAATKNISIGNDNTFGPRLLNGYVDEVRITKGLARYTANFTPPAAAFPMGATVLGVVRDASGNPAARLVRALREDTGAFVGSATSNATTGAYSIPAVLDTAHTVIAYPASGENLPALVARGVVPV